jgi:hypothetical protein
VRKNWEVGRVVSGESGRGRADAGPHGMGGAVRDAPDAEWNAIPSMMALARTHRGSVRERGAARRRVPGVREGEEEEEKAESSRPVHGTATTEKTTTTTRDGCGRRGSGLEPAGRSGDSPHDEREEGRRPSSA